MKHLRSILTSIIAIVMVFAMGVNAYADGDTHTISLNPDDTHTYDVFQVLTGRVEEQDEDVLLNPAWGSNATNTSAYANVNEFINAINDTNLTDQDKAELVASVVNTKGEPFKTVGPKSPATGLPTGYYVMVDTTELEGDHVADTKALHVVKVVNDINGLAIKWGTTEDNKKIATDSLGVGNVGDEHEVNGKIDDVSIGDIVNYEITAKIPANADLYNHFYFVINDTLDKGLTLKSDTIKVYKRGSDNNSVQLTQYNETNKTGDYKLLLAPNADGKSFQVGLTDAKNLKGNDIIVTYSAELNQDAKIGENPNLNESTVTYSNNPNHVYDGENYPAFPGEKDKTAIGETPVTRTETYTTGIQITKVDGNGQVLRGASFTLTGNSIEKVLTETETFSEAADGEYYKLKDNTYTKTVPITADTMVAAADGATEGYVEDASYNGDDKVEINGVTYRPYAPASDTNAQVFILLHANSDQYDSTSIKYKKTTDPVLKEKNDEKNVQLAVDSDGVVKFDGLGAGTYTISETVTPAGYNTASDLRVEISFVKDAADKKWRATAEDADGNPVSIAFDDVLGVYKVTIVNNKGTRLPSTGGIGTTIFYIVGGVMVAGAVVFLLTKRRMTGNE